MNVDDQISLAKEAQDEFKPSDDLKAKLQKPLQAWCHTFDLKAAEVKKMNWGSVLFDDWCLFFKDPIAAERESKARQHGSFDA